MKKAFCLANMSYDQPRSQAFSPSSFDRLQYEKMEGEGLVSFITGMTSVSTQVNRGGEGSLIAFRRCVLRF